MGGKWECMHFVINFQSLIQSFILNITRNEIEQIKYLDLASKSSFFMFHFS